MMRPHRIEPGPGQESVWDYPRPPRLERVREPVSIRFAGAIIADTKHAFRVLETSHPPVYYLPPDDVMPSVLQSPTRSSICEWKGAADALDVVMGERRAVRAAWRYPAPTPAFRDIANFVAFYAAPMDACFVGEEAVIPQPGTFYGGWITSRIVGPFKGSPGTMGW